MVLRPSRTPEPRCESADGRKIRQHVDVFEEVVVRNKVDFNLGESGRRDERDVLFDCADGHVFGKLFEQEIVSF